MYSQLLSVLCDGFGFDMGIPEIEWLAKAQRQAIHSEQRTYHNHEGRPNLVVGNKPDRWWCYCHSCKQGGVVMKSHVTLTNTPEPINSRLLTRPTDTHSFALCAEDVRLSIAAFLARKNMDMAYLPIGTGYSPERKRLILSTVQGWLGRDLTEKSPSKWITYDNQTYLGDSTWDASNQCAVIVEDPFSFYKVKWACKDLPVAVLSSLGTRIHDKLLVRILANHSYVVMFYDGDEAGILGATKSKLKLQGMGIHGYAMCAPKGLDPKDMTVLAIQSYIKPFLAGTQSTS